MKTKKIPACHSDRPYFAKGQCQSCYYKQRYDPEKRKYYHSRDKEIQNPRSRIRDRKEYAETKSRLSKQDFKLWTERNNLKRYGFRGAEIDRIIALRRNGSCEICGRVPNLGEKLHIDHCHSSNQFRGILCADCNRGIGCFKDSQETLILAAKYLVGFKNRSCK